MRPTHSKVGHRMSEANMHMLPISTVAIGKNGNNMTGIVNLIKFSLNYVNLII
jgi:hypothetical protein